MDRPGGNPPFSSLEHHFLIAMPGLRHSGFADALIYVCRHTAEGAMGLRVNHRLDVTMRELFLHLGLPSEGPLADQLLLAGGPVRSEWGFVLHPSSERRWQSTLGVTEGVALTASRDIIAALATGDDAPAQSLVALGYAGWGAGQLEDELRANAWLTVAAESDLLFEVPIGDRARLAAARVGVDLTRLSPCVGHA